MRSSILAAGAALLAASPVGAEVVDSSATHFVTRDSATVPKGPTEVWLALISPGKWWNDEHSWSGDAANMTLIPQGGGCLCERIPGEESASTVGLAGSALHMTVVQANPQKVLRLRGGLGPLQSEPVDGVLTITLKPVDGGTEIVWEYVVGGTMRYEVPVISKAVDGVMSQQLSGLATFLGGARAAPSADPVPEPEPAEATESVEDAFQDMAESGEGR